MAGMPNTPETPALEGDTVNDQGDISVPKQLRDVCSAIYGARPPGD